MMLPTEFIYMIGLDRHRERLRKAARNRHMRQTRKVQERSSRLALLLVWLGRRFVAWGRRLEDRYGAEPRPLHSGL